MNITYRGLRDVLLNDVSDGLVVVVPYDSTQPVHVITVQEGVSSDHDMMEYATRREVVDAFERRRNDRNARQVEVHRVKGKEEAQVQETKLGEAPGGEVG